MKASVNEDKRWMQPSRVQRPTRKSTRQEWLWAVLVAVVISVPLLVEIAKALR